MRSGFIRKRVSCARKVEEGRKEGRLTIVEKKRKKKKERKSNDRTFFFSFKLLYTRLLFYQRTEKWVQLYGEIGVEGDKGIQRRYIRYIYIYTHTHTHTYTQFLSAKYFYSCYGKNEVQRECVAIRKEEIICEETASL